MSSCLTVIIRDNDNNNNKFYLQDIMQGYVKISSNLDRDFYIWPRYKQISLLIALFNSIIKAIKLLYDVPEASSTSFANYHPHQKKKQEMTEFAHQPFFLQPLSNLTDSAHDSSFLWSSQTLLLLLDVTSDSVVKFVSQHSDFKEKLNSNQTRTFVCDVDYLHLDIV